jgi:hypothetical protein
MLSYKKVPPADSVTQDQITIYMYERRISRIVIFLTEPSTKFESTIEHSLILKYQQSIMQRNNLLSDKNHVSIAKIRRT